jgi:peptidoglycan hydrolase CwlO-like protein
MRLQEAKRQRDEIRYEIRLRQERIKANETCEQRYEALLREKAEAVTKSDPALAEKLADLEQQELGLVSRKKELDEAISAGRQTMDHIQAAILDLDDAEGWSAWDILGGGLIADAMKYSSMDDAQQKMEQVQSDLCRYQAELADVAQTASVDLQPDGFLQFADFFWDGIFADFAVRDRIDQSQGRMQNLREQVQQIQTGLEQELAETERGLKKLREERNEWIRNA